MSRNSAEPIGGGLSRTASTKTTSLGRRLPDARALRYRLKLAGELGSALHRNDVQLVILNDAPPLLAHRVLSRCPGIRALTCRARAVSRADGEPLATCCRRWKGTSPGLSRMCGRDASVVDRFVVAARITKIREYVAYCKIRGLADERRFVIDPLIYGTPNGSCSWRFRRCSTSAITSSPTAACRCPPTASHCSCCWPARR